MQKLMIASGPVIVENNAVLLTKHGEDLFWKFPGGRTNGLEETLHQAASRNALAETGIELDFADRQPFFMHVHKSTDQGPIDVILVHYLAHRKGEITQGEHVRAYIWAKIDQLPDDVGPNIRPTLQHFGFLK